MYSTAFDLVNTLVHMCDVLHSTYIFIWCVWMCPPYRSTAHIYTMRSNDLRQKKSVSFRVRKNPQRWAIAQNLLSEVVIQITGCSRMGLMKISHRRLIEYSTGKIYAGPSFYNGWLMSPGVYISTEWCSSVLCLADPVTWSSVQVNANCPVGPLS